MPFELHPETILPVDAHQATLIGRAWLPEPVAGPAVVLVRGHDVIDISGFAPTVSTLLEKSGLVQELATLDGPLIGSVSALLANSSADRRDPDQPYFLTPIDLQAIKACGVTFVVSMLERVIEEQAKGDPQAAASIRETINAEIGSDLAAVVPGSAAADRLKQALQQRGVWSQYLEVGIGPYAEVFTKAQPMSAVGIGAEIGIHPESTWNNPEPEVWSWSSIPAGLSLA